MDPALAVEYVFELVVFLLHDDLPDQVGPAQFVFLVIHFEICMEHGHVLLLKQLELMALQPIQVIVMQPWHNLILSLDRQDHLNGDNYILVCFDWTSLLQL